MSKSKLLVSQSRRLKREQKRENHLRLKTKRSPSEKETSPTQYTGIGMTEFEYRAIVLGANNSTW